ncbi:toxin glutamine deamidase domain-containing protein [Nocardia sp. X0981]
MDVRLNGVIAAFRRAADDLTRVALHGETPAVAGVMRQAGEDLRRAMDVLDDQARCGGDRIAAAARARPTGPPSLQDAGDFSWLRPRGQSADRVNREIDAALTAVNPNFDPSDPRRRNNCVAVATAYELRRRGYDVSAQGTPLPFPFEEGFPHSLTEVAWGRRFTTVLQRSQLREAFREPGSRGIVIADWRPGAARLDRGDSHVFNIEHVPGTGIRIVDGQPDPPLVDATAHIRQAAALRYLRVDGLPDPAPGIVEYLGIRTVGPEALTNVS